MISIYSYINDCIYSRAIFAIQYLHWYILYYKLNRMWIVLEIIAVDLGRSGVKVIASDRELYFPSRVGDARIMNVGENRNYIVAMDGKEYFVGDMAIESYTQREMATKAKEHSESRILFATAIGAVIKGPEVYVITGLPINLHSNHKTSMATYLQGKYRVKINGIEKNFVVKEIAVAAEGAGTFYRLQGINKKQGTIRILNLGSRTINALTVRDGRFWDKESTSLDWGLFEVDNAGDNLGIREQFDRKIKADISKIWLSYQADSDLVVLCGGGALRLGEQLQDLFTVVQIVEDPIFEDVRGMYEMGITKWAGN